MPARFSLDATLRRLGRRLVEHDGLPVGHARVPLRPDGLVSTEEHSFLISLAACHLCRHTPIEIRPGDPAPCPNMDRWCRSVGLARAILRGCDALRDRKELKHVTELREALAKAERMLDKLSAALDDYLASNEILDERRWNGLAGAARERGTDTLIHVHSHVCVAPRLLRGRVASLRRRLSTLDERSLVPQFASAAIAANRPGRKRRPFLLAEMQADLAREGWCLEEVAQIIDDGLGGELAAVKDRIRKRIAPYVFPAGRGLAAERRRGAPPAG